MGGGPSKPLPYPLLAPGTYPHHEPHSQWSVSKKSKKHKKNDDRPTYGYQDAPYGYSYYPQMPSRYPYYAPVQMAVMPVQQPVLAMPQSYVPVVPVQTTTAAQPAAFAQMPVPVPPPAPVAIPASAPAQPAPEARMPEPVVTNAATAGQSQGPVIPPIPVDADPASALPPPPILGDAQRVPGSMRPRFTDFYRPADPPIAQPGGPNAMPDPDVPFRPPTAPPMRMPMRGNPLPEPPKDVWNSSPYRQVLANLPNDVGRLFNFENLQQQTVLDQPERSSSRLGGLFGSRRDKEKKSLKGLFRSFSTSAHGHQGSSSRHGHHHSQPQVTSFVIPPILGDPPPGADAAPRSPVIPIPQPGPPVRFNHTGDYSGFVNHSHHRVLYRNKTYPTALHLLEAMKFTERPDLAERIRTCADVNDMYPLSASFQQFVRSDWGQVFLKTMDEVLHLKFKQHPVLRALLLRTGLSDIIYADANSYWGEGPQGEGANELGKALARVRDRLRREGER